MCRMTGPGQHRVTKALVTRGQLGSRTTDLEEHVAVGVHDDHLRVVLNVECRLLIVDCV